MTAYNPLDTRCKPGEAGRNADPRVCLSRAAALIEERGWSREGAAPWLGRETGGRLDATTAIRYAADAMVPGALSQGRLFERAMGTLHQFLHLGGRSLVVWNSEQSAEAVIAALRGAAAADLPKTAGRYPAIHNG